MIHINTSPRHFSTAIAFLLGCLAVGLTACVGQNDNPKSDVIYDYPVKPGTQEWRVLKSHDEMLKVCQIPDALLHKMSTKALVETVLNYPLYGDIFAYLNFQAGFNSVASNFNGISELLNRKDAGTELLARYRAMDPAAIDKSWTLLQQGQYDTKFTYIEMLLAQDAILASLTETERHDLLADALKKSQAKQKYSEIYGQFGLERTALLMGRILQKENFAPFNQKAREDATLRAFLGDGATATDTILNEIFSQAKEFLAQR